MLFRRTANAESKSSLFELLILKLNSCHRFFYYYRDIAGAIYPVIEDIEKFESSLELLLANRVAAGGVYREDGDEAQSPFGTNIAYLGLLYAVLASGCQSSDLGSKERELTSQVYGMACEKILRSSFTNSLFSLLLISVSANDKFLISTNY